MATPSLRMRSKAWKRLSKAECTAHPQKLALLGALVHQRLHAACARKGDLVLDSVSLATTFFFLGPAFSGLCFGVLCGLTFAAKDDLEGLRVCRGTISAVVLLAGVSGLRRGVFCAGDLSGFRQLEMESRDGTLYGSGEEIGTVDSSKLELVLRNDLDLSWKVSISRIFGLASKS
ncbi:hypothetical protein MUK42_34370 [Musa troglodytarum]|uniref:Uncharacterized protein n=1 Tax=Musa troglodytarum TaxID=320322 RepID=A0A9E7GCE0_9LILI|nr:hypothetical protein MUK42_34370 [Musa troglodytarum]